MPKKEKEWTEKDRRNLLRFLLRDEKETLSMLENMWSVNDRYDKNWEKYVVRKEDA